MQPHQSGYPLPSCAHPVIHNGNQDEPDLSPAAIGCSLLSAPMILVVPQLLAAVFAAARNIMLAYVALQAGIRPEPAPAHHAMKRSVSTRHRRCSFPRQFATAPWLAVTATRHEGS